MKLRDLVAELERAGCVLLRNGAKHDIYHNPVNGRSEPGVQDALCASFDCE